MVDIGFWEVGVILIIALLVIGPERLPKLARSVGKMVTKLRRIWQGVQSEAQDIMKEDDDKKHPPRNETTSNER